MLPHSWGSARAVSDVYRDRVFGRTRFLSAFVGDRFDCYRVFSEGCAGGHGEEAYHLVVRVEVDRALCDLADHEEGRHRGGLCVCAAAAADPARVQPGLHVSSNTP